MSQADTPRINFGTPKQRFRLQRPAKVVEAQKAEDAVTERVEEDRVVTARALARMKEKRLKGQELVAQTCKALDDVRKRGRVPIAEWKQALEIQIAEADDALAERCPTWVDKPGADTAWVESDSDQWFRGGQFKSGLP